MHIVVAAHKRTKIKKNEDFVVKMERECVVTVLVGIVIAIVLVCLSYFNFFK